MPAVTLTPTDLAPFASIDETKAQEMIDTAMARAARVAPCIRDTELSEDNATAAKGIIRDAVLRWNDQGTGAVQAQTAGPFSVTVDSRQARRTLFWPSEIEELQAICSDHAGTAAAGAFSVDTATGLTGTAGHADICSINFGATYCSCGAVLTNELYPLYEV